MPNVGTCTSLFKKFKDVVVPQKLDSDSVFIFFRVLLRRMMGYWCLASTLMVPVGT
jgi:hypothetical protein